MGVVTLSLDGIVVQDAAGTTLQTSAFTDPDATLALLVSLTGTTPMPTEYPDFGSTTWEWPGLLFGRTSEDFSWLRSESAEIGGLPLQTAAGIQVGSSRGDVILQSPYDGNYDMDGDGESDLYGLEQRTNDEYESLEFPGLPGTEFIEVQLDGDVVSVLRAPSNDYSDV